MLRAIEVVPDEGAIELLETALEHARSGELRNVVIVGDGPGNDIRSYLAFMDGRVLLGKLSRALHRVNEVLD